ncbi:MAG: hypothetical protein WCE63_22375 [Acidobacteriaceae bacterium]
MKTYRIASTFLVAAISGAGLGVGSSALAQTENTAGKAQVIVTVNADKPQAAAPLQPGDITVKVKGRPSAVESVTPINDVTEPTQLVFLFDESARSYLALQFPDLRKFIQALPASTSVAVAYMNNGRAVMAQKLTADHKKAADSLRLTNGIPGITGSPYFCLSDLAKNWPSQEKARRVVFMVTNGEDPYYRSRDMQDPYVAAAIQDSQKARLLVYSIYFRNTFGGGSRSFSTLMGQSYLQYVADDTGGQFYSMAMSSPVSFEPFLKQFKQSLERQYLLIFATGSTGWQRVQVQSKAGGIKLTAPKAIYVEKNP